MDIRCDFIGQLGQFFKTIFGMGENGFITLADKNSFSNNIFLIAAAVIFCFPVIEIFKKSKLYASEKSKNITTVLTTVISAILLLVSSIMLVDATTNPFLYFRF